MSDYFDRVERQIVRRVQGGVPRTARPRVSSGNLAVAAAVLVVIGVAGVFLAVRGSGNGAPSPVASPAVTVAFTTAPGTSPRAIDQSVSLVAKRLHAVLPGARVARTGDGITVTVARATPGARSEILALAARGRLAVYDWEADVLAPGGKAVAAQLPAQNPTALEISQGNAGQAPGYPGSGCLSLQQARTLAHREQGLVVLQAIDPNPRHPTSPNAPGAGFYVLRGAPALTNADVVDPRASTEPNTRVPDVTFDLTPRGRQAFQVLTATIARRGEKVSGLGETLNQHFAVAIDGHLITVPFVDYKVYPDGVDADNSVDLSGSFTTQMARLTAILLRYGPLPVNLTAAG